MRIRSGKKITFGNAASPTTNSYTFIRIIYKAILVVYHGQLVLNKIMYKYRGRLYYNNGENTRTEYKQPDQ